MDHSDVVNLRTDKSAVRLLPSKTHFTIIFLYLALIIAGVGNARTSQASYRVSSPGTNSQSPVHTDHTAEVESVTRRFLGARITLAKERKPYFLTGDFNGDASEDLLVVVRVEKESTLPSTVNVINPWSFARPDFSTGPALALAVIHGGSTGWDTENPRGIYLLTDREFFATPIWEDSTQEGLLSIKKKLRGRRGPVPSTAKGDAISVATEAGIDTFLYWNGKTYRLFTPAEAP